MTRTVIHVDPLGQHQLARLAGTPLNIAGQMENEPLDLANLPEVGTAEERGDALYQRLRQHTTIRSCLESLLTQAAVSASPVYVRPTGSVAEQVPWEILRVGGTFLALDERWSIGRIATRSGQVDDLVYAPPVRVLAVLSAAGRPAEPEWLALKAALVNGADRGVPLRVLVLVSEVDLLDAIRDARADVAFTLDAAAMPASAEALRQQILEFGPHLLHLFCHGSAQEVPQLHLATVADREDPQAPSSVILGVEGLGRALRGIDVWLVTLDACQSGLATQATASLANELASEGVPAVVGMQRLIDQQDVATFCEAFYRRLLARISELVTADGRAPQVLELADLLPSPRRALSDRAQVPPEADDRWSVPVLYVREHPLRILVARDEAGIDELHREAVGNDNTSGLLDALASAGDTPPGLVADVRATLPEEGDNGPGERDANPDG